MCQAGFHPPIHQNSLLATFPISPSPIAFNEHIQQQEAAAQEGGHRLTTPHCQVPPLPGMGHGGWGQILNDLGSYPIYGIALVLFLKTNSCFQCNLLSF